MMKPKVLNLIQKFEKLSNDISSSKCVPVRQKSITIPIRVDTPLPSPCVEATAVSNQQGWNPKPLLEIENGIRRLKKQLGQILPGDEKAILEMFMEMMDLLIQLGGIDTDGLKTLKVKKECCLAELRKTKNDLKELIASNDLSGCKTDEVNTAFPTSEEANKKSPALHICQSNIEPNDNMYPKAGVVHSLMKQFEDYRPEKQQGTNHKEVHNIYKNLSVLDRETDEEIESVECVGPQKNSLEDINSEIAYYKEVMPSLDVEDFIKIESIEEHLQGLLVSAECYADAKKEIAVLLKHVTALKNGDDSMTKTDEKSIDISESPSGVLKSTNPSALIEECQDFLQGEKSCEYVRKPTVPVVLVDEPLEQQSTDDCPTAMIDQLPEAQGREKLSTMPVEVNPLEDDCLTKSVEMIETYKAKIREYLTLSYHQLLAMEATIEENLDIITKFSAHPDVETQFNTLKSSYKELLNYITEEKFAKVFNETVDDASSGEAIAGRDSMINDFYSLCSEIRNYYPYIEKLHESSPFQVNALRENMLEVADEIRLCDLSFSEDLKIKKENALKELKDLLARL